MSTMYGDDFDGDDDDDDYGDDFDGDQAAPRQYESPRYHSGRMDFWPIHDKNVIFEWSAGHFARLRRSRNRCAISENLENCLRFAVPHQPDFGNS